MKPNHHTNHLLPQSSASAIAMNFSSALLRQIGPVMRACLAFCCLYQFKQSFIDLNLQRFHMYQSTHTLLCKLHGSASFCFT
ncbi:hypothetical protein Hdeb2414_s0597g00922031 [Helianthus debilis subsp. tardiflorus]